MRYVHKRASAILAVGLTFYAMAPASASSDGKDHGTYAGWLTACGALDQSGHKARRAWEKWLDKVGWGYFGQDGTKTFMTYYDLAVSGHGWADNNLQVCARALANEETQEMFNKWLGEGLKLLETED